MQAIFWATLHAIQRTGRILSDSRELAEWFAGEYGRPPILRRPRDTFESAIARVRETLPSPESWTHRNHEIQRARSLLEALAENDSAEKEEAVLRAAVEIILAIMGDVGSKATCWKGHQGRFGAP